MPAFHEIKALFQQKTQALTRFLTTDKLNHIDYITCINHDWATWDDVCTCINCSENITIKTIEMLML